MREVTIFGNGLGMAVDSNYFRLESALRQAWQDPEALTDDQRELILRCLRAEGELIDNDAEDRAPSSEEELGTLQRVLAACDEILKLGRDGDHQWLTEEGQRFPYAIRSYVHRTASHLHLNPYYLPKEFSESLVSYVLESRTHIATLNYDELLYRTFLSTPAMNGFSCLIDGFVRTFDPDNLNRRSPQRQSYCLHLHGSPLYITEEDGAIRKAALRQAGQVKGHESTHLVLTHFDYKSTIISASPILSAYWQRLREALAEVDGVTLFGYSGADHHLNEIIQTGFTGRVRVVEYVGDKTGDEVQSEWNSRLGRDVELILMENILDFRAW